MNGAELDLPREYDRRVYPTAMEDAWDVANRLQTKNEELQSEVTRLRAKVEQCEAAKKE